MKPFTMTLVALATSIFLSDFAQAQTSMLEKKVIIPSSTYSISEVFTTLSNQTGCVFSYAGGVVDIDKKVQVVAQNKSMRDVLHQMFGNSIQCTERKQFVVLTRMKSGVVTSSGYVQNLKGEPIVNATIYDPVRLTAARTNDYGYYEIKLKSDSVPPLVVNKENFEDTLLKPADGRLSYITLEQRDTTWLHKAEAWQDSVNVSVLKVQDWTAQAICRISEVRNVHDSLSRDVQVSFLPMIGTNGLLSPKVSNRWSLNIIGGINGGVRGAEVAGMFNIDRGDVAAFQSAGFMNLVLGNVQGMQSAGFMNMVDGKSQGFQSAGFLNVNSNSSFGMQTAGFMNLNRHGYHGLTVAGFYNQTSDTLKGCQVAGFMNVANRVEGAQIAGFLNKAKVVDGAQIGFINIADTIHGAPIGFLSIIKSGYQQIAPYYDELSYAGIQWRSGTNFFYNIVDVAVRLEPVNGKNFMAFGYGFGISTNTKKPWIWNNDFTVHQYLPGKWIDPQMYVGKWHTGVERKLGRVISLSAGITANVQAYEQGGQSIIFPFSNDQMVWSEKHISGFSYQSWLGWKVGVRFNLNPRPRRS